MAYGKGTSFSNGRISNITTGTNSDKLTEIFGNKTIDVSRTLKILSAKKASQKVLMTNYSPDEDKKSINMQVTEKLHQIGFFGLNKHTPMSTIGLHGTTFNYQQQRGRRSSTIDATVNAWNNITRLQSNQTGNLFVFDLETYGGKTKDLRWNPQGITEFAMETFDFTTGTQTSKQVLMIDDKTIEDLDKFWTRYQEVMSAPDGKGLELLMADDELRVTAMRMSLHDRSKGADFVRKNGVWEIVSLGDTKKAEPGNVDSVLRGVQEFKKMHEELKKENLLTNPVTGLSYSMEELIKATGQMSIGMSQHTGVVAGHNISDFDRGILDKTLRSVYDTQVSIMNNTALEDSVSVFSGARDFSCTLVCFFAAERVFLRLPSCKRVKHML